MSTKKMAHSFQDDLARMDRSIGAIRAALGLPLEAEVLVAEETTPPTTLEAPCMACGEMTTYDPMDTDSVVACPECIALAEEAAEDDDDDEVTDEDIEAVEAAMDRIHVSLTTALVELELLRRPELRFR